ncbi:Tol-Pal system protein TolB [Sulfurimonas sp.]|uniref:Tol-Pal system protein TolB n=1 Tax=Sulfurimonas sp. TaxID=2022749 RepID=UPI0025E3E8D8|nr:Tol-Pal system protein TolB [Sulfurimonas sp.]MDD5156539.1 Tol-Pal system protein TolB [Sulfurimonas sp.]
MRVILILFVLISLLYSTDATIEVIKKTDLLPSLAIEDSSEGSDEMFKTMYFKSIVADMNVLSIFNVDNSHHKNSYDASSVLVENKNVNYVVRYKTSISSNGTLNVEMKLLSKNGAVFIKNYSAKNIKTYIFVIHSMAYDINKFLNQPSVEWIKRKVIFAKMTAPKKSEIFIADYTLTYRQVVVSGGLNLFPKWANKEQTSFYFSSLNENKPTLKYVEMTTGKSRAVISSDGMMVCSDVSEDGKKLLLTMAQDGQPDIYLYGVESKKLDRLTKYKGIDVGGQFVGADGIVFVSDRLGYPNIFYKKNNLNGAEQVIFKGKSNSACSVFNKYIVYKARESSSEFLDNTFNLYLASTDSDLAKRLTSVGVNEFPRFSVDGDAIIFIRNFQGQSSIGVIRINHDTNFLFPLKDGKIQSMDW